MYFELIINLQVHAGNYFLISIYYIFYTQLILDEIRDYLKLIIIIVKNLNLIVI